MISVALERCDGRIPLNNSSLKNEVKNANLVPDFSKFLLTTTRFFII